MELILLVIIGFVSNWDIIYLFYMFESGVSGVTILSMEQLFLYLFINCRHLKARDSDCQVNSSKFVSLGKKSVFW